MLTLAASEPIAVGHLRLVFQHPDAPSLLIKIMRPEVVATRFARWYKQLPRAKHYANHVRELKEYIAAHARKPHANPPLARMVGLAEADLGLGLVVERVVDDRGALAPTLDKLVRRDGLLPWMEQALAEFFAQVLEHELIVGDMHPGNLVYGSDSRGGPRLVLIDGFGEKNAIPTCSMSRRLNRRNSHRRYAVLLRQIARLVAARQLPSSG
ncbi:MAG: YrbL family protein [Tahibacter sp.]